MSREELWTQSVRHRASLRSPLKLEKHPLVRAHLWNRGTGALNNIHSEITCGVPVDWRLGNFNNVTLYTPPRSLTPKSLPSRAQSELRGRACTLFLPAQHRHFQQMWNLGKPGHEQASVSRRKATLPGHSSAGTEGRHHPAGRATAKQRCTGLTAEFGMQPGMTQNTAQHPCHEKEDPWLWMAQSR